MTNLVQQLDEWQDYVDDEELRLVLASAAAELRKRKRKPPMIKLITMVCSILILLCLSDINDNVRAIKVSLRERPTPAFTEVEKRKLQDLEAAMNAIRVPR